MNITNVMDVGTFQSTIVNSKPCDGTGMNRVLQKLPNIKHVYKKYNFTLVVWISFEIDNFISSLVYLDLYGDPSLSSLGSRAPASGRGKGQEGNYISKPIVDGDDQDHGGSGGELGYRDFRGVIHQGKILSVFRR